MTYLTLSAGQHYSRDHLATLLWGHRQDDQAKGSLRHELHKIRQVLGDERRDIITSDDDTVALKPGVIDSDVHEFQHLANSGELQELVRAHSLVRGDLLLNTAPKAEEFEQWLTTERVRLKAQHCDLLAKVAFGFQAEGAIDSAISYAERLVSLDGINEPGSRLLMSLYDVAGRYSAAMNEYLRLEKTLKAELSVEPSGETIELFEQIRQKQSSPKAPEPLGADRPRRLFSMSLGLTAVAVILVVGAVFYYYALNGPTADAPLPFPEKPSIAIIPLTDLSGGVVEPHIVTGITEEITTALSIISSMFVIDATSAAHYRPGTPSNDVIAEELGVRYVLIGSVQYQNGQIRVLCRLFDAETRAFRWGDQYDFDYDLELDDIFWLQDEIARQVIAELQVELTEGEEVRIHLERGTYDLQAWTLAARGLQHLRLLTRSDNESARAYYRQAIELDRDYPGAWTGLAWTYVVDAWFGWRDPPAAAIREAVLLAQRAFELDPERPSTLGLMGTISFMTGHHEKAVELGEKALKFNPNGADSTALLALTLGYTGGFERSIMLAEHAMELSPHSPIWYSWVLAHSLRLSGEPQRAVDILTEAIDIYDEAVLPHVELASALVQLGRQTEAREISSRLLQSEPDFSVGGWLSTLPYADPSVREIERDILSEAGFPQ